VDKKITKKKWPVQRILGILALVLILGGVFAQLGFADRSSKLNIDPERLSFSDVQEGVFQEYIAETGEIVPNQIYFLDAVEGGNIVKVIEKSGAIVQKGDPIIQLENGNLRLNVLTQENSLNEQLNRVRTTRLSLDQNFLNHKKELALIEYQLEMLAPKFMRDSALYANKIISLEEFQNTKAEYSYNRKRLAFTKESFETDSASREIQLKQLNASEASMLENLTGVKKILNNLIIKAPITGQLSTDQLQEGQNINQGERLGQIDILGSYKVRVPIDELYLSRISKGLKARTTIDGEVYELVITYIYPTVTGGEFEVNMEFSAAIPEGLKSGQSLRLKIELGKSSQELLLPVGGFFNSTGGNWVFVVDEVEKRAQRRLIRLGRKNAEHFEVLEGLKPGDRVVTSSYDNFGDNEILVW